MIYNFVERNLDAKNQHRPWCGTLYLVFVNSISDISEIRDVLDICRITLI